MGQIIWTKVMNAFRLNNKEYHNLLLLDNKSKKSMMLTLMFISIYNIILDQYSLYKFFY